MENIVAYDSDGSENSQNPTPKKEVAEHGRSTTSHASMLEAEWNSFEKMIGDSPSTTNSKTIGDAPLLVPAPVPPVGVPAPVAPSSDSEAASSSSSSSSESDSDSEAESEDDKKKSSKSKAKKKSKSGSESSDSSSSEEEEEEEEEDSSDSDSSSVDEKSGNSSSASEEAKTEVTTKSSPLVSQAKTADLEIVESANHEPVGISDKSGSPEKATTENSEVRDRRSSERRRSSHHSRSRSHSRDRHRRRSSSGSRRRHGRSRSRSPRRRRSSRSRKSRSRSRERHRDRKGRSPDRQKSHRSSHHRSSRSRSRDRRSSRSDHKRHSSRDRHRRKRSRDRRRRSRSRDRRSRRGRDRSRDRHRRSRSRSRTPDGRRGRYKRGKKDDMDKKPRSFKEHLKQQLLNVQKQAADGKLTLDFDLQKKLMEDSKIASGVKLSAATNPLVSLSTTGEKVTPQEALLQTMAAMHQKAQELTGVAVPKYYNPAAVNPLKYAEQVQKRKLLWSKAKDKKEDTTAAWGQAGFNQDQDGKVAAKFRKLMGINKSEEEMAAESEQHPTSTSSHSTAAQDAQIHPKAEELMQKQQELFQQLDKEYEFARMTTHTHRGVGLGFASHVPTFPK